MSQPVPQGYPDFVRRTPMSDQIVINTSGSSALTQTFGPFYSGNVPAYIMFFQGSGTYSQVLIDWYLDSAATILLGTSRRDYAPTTFGRHTFRSITPYFKVRIVPVGGPTLTYKLILMTTSDVQAPVFSQGYVNVIGQTANGVVGGGQIQAFSQVVHDGTAIWTARCTAASWDATLSTQDSSASLTDIDRVDNTSGGGTSRMVFLSSARAVITLNNHDAGAQTYSIYLSLNPVEGT